MEYAKINVLIVTYKQADVIGRNIESILQQKEYGLNKIIICDDCSPDNNWEVIQEYVRKYPQYIIAYRNEHNLGIYGNSNKLLSLKGDADLYCWLEGDDALKNGLFKNAQEQIPKENIDLKEKVGIFHDFVVIDVNGTSKKYSNRHIMDNKMPLSLYIRGMVSWRATLFSKSVLDSFIKVTTDCGVGLAESMFDSQFFKYLKNTYYSPIEGSIYYSGIGVSTQLGGNSSYNTTEVINNNNILIDFWGLNKKDCYWMMHLYYKAQCQLTFSNRCYLKVLYYYIIGSIGYNFHIKHLCRLAISYFSHSL